MKTRLSFKQWLLRQVERSDEVGELARVVVDAMPNFATGGDKNTVLMGLLGAKAPAELLLTVERAYQEFQRQRFFDSAK